MTSPTAKAAAAALTRHGQGTKIRLRADADGSPQTPTLVFDRLDGDGAILFDEHTLVNMQIDLETLGRRGERRATYAGAGAAAGLTLLAAGCGLIGKRYDVGGGGGITLPQLFALIGGGIGVVIGGAVGYAFDRWDPLVFLDGRGLPDGVP